MKLLCLLLVVANSMAATLLEGSSREENPTVPPQMLTTPPIQTETRSPFAMLDDVRLIANGLLQLGQTLRDFVHKTKGQINDIFQRLNIFDQSFNQLSVVTSEIKEEEEELKKTTHFLKVNNEEIRNLSLEINSKINSIMQDRMQLQSKVGSLEERLTGLSEYMVPADQHAETATLKKVIEGQEKTITNLMEAVKEQHDQLDHQKIQIKNLEEKLSFDSFQDTADKVIDSDPAAPDPFEYLTGNSSGLDTSDLPMDCSELFDTGEGNSGIYVIKPNQSEPFNAYCEMGSDGGSTVIQRRVDGSVDFDQTWEKYDKGFGDMDNEFWLGLKKIHSLAKQRRYVLRVEVEGLKNEKHWAEYHFSLQGPSTHYTLHLDHVSDDLFDFMANTTGMSFSTRDDDNHRNSRCARNYSGGWWFNACSEINLNKKHMWLRAKGRSMRRKVIQWKNGSGASYPLKATKMTIRPTLTDQSIN